MATQSYITVKNALEQFANNHLAIKRFKTSFFEQIDNFSSSDNIFPILYVVPSDVTFEQYTDRFFFRVYCVDILQKDRSNESAILNDTLLTLRDLYNWLKIADNGLNVLTTARAIPVNNFLVDYTAGWYLDVEVEGQAESNDCSIPFSENFNITGYTCDYTYATSFLTCETLAACQTIIDINNRIDGIVLSADTFTVGGSYDNSTGTLSLLRNDGGLIPITGFTTGGTSGFDVFVTGGTYSNSTGIATFTNNTGGTFTVTGFNISGDTSNFVPYIGANQNVQLGNNDLILTAETDSNAIIVNNLTGGTQVAIGNGSSDAGFISIYDADDILRTNIEAGRITTRVVTADNFIVNGGTSDQILLADGSLGVFPFDVFVTGGTYSSGTATFTNNTGGTFNVTGFSTSGGSSTFTGGTVSGPTNFLNGLSANTISATTYQGLPLDITITGGTYSSGSTTLTLTNNTGGTINVTGFTSGGSTGGTVSTGATVGSFGITIDGLGGVISLGQQGFISIPYNATINGWTLLGDQTGDCIIDVWKDSYGNFPPTSGDSITGSEKPTLSAQASNRDLNLTTWTTNITSGDVIGFNVLSATSVTRINLIINVTKI